MLPYIFILPIAAGLTAQIIKFFIRGNKQKFNFKNILAYSGMPSGHSAMVVSLAVIIALTEGWQSPIFALSAIFAIIIIRDAVGIRRYLGEHGKILNTLVKNLEDEYVITEEKYPHLLERIGHTPAQMLAGAAIGFLVSIFGYWLLY